MKKNYFKRWWIVLLSMFLFGVLQTQAQYNAAGQGAYLAFGTSFWGSNSNTNSMAFSATKNAEGRSNLNALQVVSTRTSSGAVTNKVVSLDTPTFSVVNNQVKVHAIVYARAINAGTVNAGPGIGASNTMKQSTNAALGTEWTRFTLAYSTNGSISYRLGFTFSIASNGEGMIADDAVVYLSADGTTDITAPSQAVPVEATISLGDPIQWDEGVDAGTGVQNTLIWQQVGSNNVLTLYQQGGYTTEGMQVNANGQINASGDWELVAIIPATSARDFIPEGEGTYAIVHRDLAYNYSAPAYVTVNSASTEPSVRLTLSGTGDKDQTIMETESIEEIRFELRNANKENTEIEWDGGAPAWINVDKTTTEDIIIFSGTSTKGVAGTYTYTITPSNGTTTGVPISGTITVTPYVAPTVVITPKAGTDIAKKAGETISIVYDIENANATNGASVAFTPVDGAVATGLDFSFEDGVLTVSGTLAAQTVYPAVINYAITTTDLEGAEGTTASGVITVKDPNAKAILYIIQADNQGYTATEQANDKLLQMLDANYDLTVRDRQTTGAEAIDYSDYDLVVLHESCNGGDAGTAGNELNNIIKVDIPVLNTKSFFYSNGRWGWGTPNSPGNTPTAKVLVPEHPIFAGVTLTENQFNMFNTAADRNMQYSTITVGGTILAVPSNNEDGTQAVMHELTAEQRGAAFTKGYLMVSALATNLDDLTDNGLLVYKNACDYLMGTMAANTEAQITEFSINGTEGEINEDAKTISVMLPIGTDITQPLPVAFKASRNATVSVNSAPVVSGDNVDFSTSPVTFSVQAEDESIAPVAYSVTVEVATAPAPEITGGANKDQDILIGAAIEAIEFTAINYESILFVYGEAGTEADFEAATGLVVEINEGAISITGPIAATANIGDYTYTITAVKENETVEDAVVSGTISVDLGTPVANAAANITETAAELSWSEVAGADSYTVTVTTVEQLGETQWTTPQVVNNNGNPDVENLDLTPANGPYIIEFELAASSNFTDVLGFTPSGSAPGSTNAGARITIGTNDNKFVADNTFKGGRIVPILNPSLTLDGSFSKYQLLLEGAVEVDNNNATVIDESSFIQFRNQSAGAGSFTVQNVKVLKVTTVIDNVPVTTNSYTTDDVLTAGTTYTYAVTAIKGGVSKVSNSVEFTTQGAPVNKDALKDAIANATAELANQANYTPDSWTAADLINVIAAAQLVDDNDEATQQDVDAQVGNITTALGKLVAKADKTALNEAIATAQSKVEDDYTPESWAAADLVNVIAAAQAVADNDNATGAEVQAQIEAIEAAIAKLVESDDVGINDGAATSTKVIGLTGAVLIENAEGATAVIANALGKAVFNGTLTSNAQTIAAPAGVTVVIVNGEAVKVLVK